MNFNIVDGDNDYLDLLPEFAELYNNKDIPASKIPEMLGVTRPTYRKLRRDALEEDLITLRHKPKRKRETYKTAPKNYSHQVCKGIEYYHVQKRIDGKLLHFATFKDARQAERMVELLRECDWDRSKVDELKARVMEEFQ